MAIAMLLSGGAMLDDLDARDAERLVRFLNEILDLEPGDSNWRLFSVLIEISLDQFGALRRPKRIGEHLAAVESYAMGDGWFRDGPAGDVDYYTIWAFHYMLAFVRMFGPEQYSSMGLDELAQITSQWRSMFDNRGRAPIFGRSLSYRGAVGCLLPIASSELGYPSASVASGCVHALWQWLVEAGGVTRGRLTQGVIGDDVALIDRYSGPASQLWSLRSLVATRVWLPPSESVPADIEKFQTEVGDGAEYHFAKSGLLFRSDGSEANVIRLGVSCSPSKRKFLPRTVLGYPVRTIPPEFNYGPGPYSSNWVRQWNADQSRCRT